MCKVSIVVPTYNVASYIGECLDSLICQTLREIEILCVDAASDDGTREILEKYAEKDSRIRILDDIKHSTGYAKNIGVEQAKGQYIGIVESDDYVAKTMFEQLYNCAVFYDTDIVKGNYKAFTGNGQDRVFALKAVSLDLRDYNRVINLQDSSRYFCWDMYTWTGIYKKSFLEKFCIRHNETPGASFQDVGFWLQVFAFARTAYLIPDYLYHYRRDNPYSSVHQNNKIYEMPGEYRFGCSCIEKNYGLNTRVLTGIIRGLYDSYSFVYGTLKQEHRKIFTNIFFQDMKKAFEENAVEESLYTEPEWRGVLAVKDSAEAYEDYRAQIEREKKKHQKQLFQIVDSREKNIIFGAGSDGTNLHAFLMESGRKKTIAFCDNDRGKTGLQINGISVLGPEALKDKKDVLIIVASKLYAESIKEQLMGSGVEKDRIYVCGVGETVPSYL